jgi:phosphate transport system protein
MTTESPSSGRSDFPSTIKREVLDHDISRITFHLRRLGNNVEEQTERATYALQQRDTALANKVIAQDEHINELRYTVEQDCLDAIATQQPVARDLRRVIAAMHMAVELERMGDHACGIANIAIQLGDQLEPHIEPLLDIPRMQVIVCDMTRQAIEAFVSRDTALARRIEARDAEIDALYVQSLRILLTHMMEDTQKVSEATYLLWAAHNLERIGDRATNLCERVVFAEEGDLGDYKRETHKEDGQGGA